MHTDYNTLIKIPGITPTVITYLRSAMARHHIFWDIKIPESFENGCVRISIPKNMMYDGLNTIRVYYDLLHSTVKVIDVGKRC